MSAAQPLSIPLIRGGASSLLPLHSHNHLFFFSFTFKQLITKPSQRCSSSFSKNQFLSELPFVWPHSGILPLDSALISLPGSCAADTPVSSGIVISLARGLAAAQKARLGKVEMFAEVGDNESPVLGAQWGLLGHAEKDF